VRRILKRRWDPDLLVRLGLAAAVFVGLMIADPGFRTVGNFWAMLNNFALDGVIALGVGITMIAGEFDISVGAIVPVCGIVTLSVLSLGVVAAIIIATVGALLFGLFQGWLIARLRINSLPVTIATLIGGGGLTYIIADDKPVSLPIQYIPLANTLEQRIWIFSPISIGAIVLYVIVGLGLRYLRSGREIYAIGGGRAEAFAAGVSRYRPLILIFCISAVFAGLTGAFTSITSGGMALGAQENLLLGAVTAALVGGVGLDGGRGTVPGIAAGVLILAALQSEISLRALPLYDQDLANGAVLLLVLSAETGLRAYQRMASARKEAVEDIGRPSDVSTRV
jgi:ribose transport system permease protein